MAKDNRLLTEEELIYVCGSAEATAQAQRDLTARLVAEEIFEDAEIVMGLTPYHLPSFIEEWQALKAKWLEVKE